jgi:prolyl-tRNA synthetase
VCSSDLIGLPGDREVDLKRLEAALSPAEAEPAGEADFARHPELVKGYIGPGAQGGGAIGPRGPRIADPATGESRSAIRYLLDPRVVPGTRWITGANQPGRHVFDLVAGRDFSADGTIEAAEVRAGDPAPDGSGPLRLERGIEMGHIFQLGRKYAQALGLTVLDENGKQVVVTMGSYGIGVSRAIAALAEAHHDDRGLAWPAHVAPAQVHIVATGKDAAVFDAADTLAEGLVQLGVEVLYDDRPRVSPGVKFADAELLGAPLIVVVGRGLAVGVVEVRPRAGEPVQVPVADAAAMIADQVSALLR